MHHALGVLDRITDRNGAALGDTQQRETFDAGGVDDGFQVAHEGLEGNLLDLPIGQAVAACVVSDQRMIPRELAIEMPPNGALEVELKMRHPVAGLDQRRSATDLRVRNLDAIGRHTELDLLFVGCVRRGRIGAGRRLGLRCFRKRLYVLRGQSEDADRVRDILDGLLTEIRKGERQLVADLVVRRAGDAKPARFAQGLEARRDVDGVAEYVVAVDDNVADIDPDAKDDALVRGQAGIGLAMPRWIPTAQPTASTMLGNSTTRHRLSY
jgi:hypothetical protein